MKFENLQLISKYFDYVLVCVCMCVCMYICVCVSVCVCVYVYSHWLGSLLSFCHVRYIFSCFA